MNTLRRLCAISIFAAMAALAAPATFADYAVLRSGATLHIAGYRRERSKILLYVQGGTVVVAASEVIRFEPEDYFPAFAKPAQKTPFARQIRAAAEQNGLDARVISSVIAAESNFRPRAISPAHAMGLMQLMPATAAQFAVRNPFDPEQNISAGARYLKQLLTKFRGSLTLALAAYNAGPGRVEEFGGVPPFAETRNYIRRVETKLKQPDAILSWKRTENRAQREDAFFEK